MDIIRPAQRRDLVRPWDLLYCAKEDLCLSKPLFCSGSRASFVDSCRLAPKKSLHFLSLAVNNLAVSHASLALTVSGCNSWSMELSVFRDRRGRCRLLVDTTPQDLIPNSY